MNKAKLFYADKLERRFTVVYTYDHDTGEVVYGTSVYHAETPKDNFVRHNHYTTAIKRCSVCPVKLNIGKNVASRDVHALIRENIKFARVKGKHGKVYDQLTGVKGERLVVPLKVEVAGITDQKDENLDGILESALAGNAKARARISGALEVRDNRVEENYDQPS